MPNATLKDAVTHKPFTNLYELTHRMLAEGDRIPTRSGRLTTPVPRIDCTTERKCAETLKRRDAWLKENAIEEAEIGKDCVELPGWRLEVPGKFPDATRYSMICYLFHVDPKRFESYSTYDRNKQPGHVKAQATHEKVQKKPGRSRH